MRISANFDHKISPKQLLPLAKQLRAAKQFSAAFTTMLLQENHGKAGNLPLIYFESGIIA
jgi:hypothetical protein